MNSNRDNYYGTKEVVVFDLMAGGRDRRRKSVSNVCRDLLSELPAEVKDIILEKLSICDAAKIATLSTQWRDAWLRLGRLVFSKSFRDCIEKEDNIPDVAEIIDNILLRHTGPVKVFTLQVTRFYPLYSPNQPDIDRWCLFLTRNGVEELNLLWGRELKLPECVFNCPTIKRLMLDGFGFDNCPLDATCIFPGVTSLVIKEVDFEFGDVFKYCIPNLVTLGFWNCYYIEKFEISSPKLQSMLCQSFDRDELSWFISYWEAIKTLWLGNLRLSDIPGNAVVLPTRTSVQVFTLYEFDFTSAKDITYLMLLLQKSPELCELEIRTADYLYTTKDEEDASRVLEDPNNCLINEDMVMLKTVKIEITFGSRIALLLLKKILSVSPALEKVVILDFVEDRGTEEFKILMELLSFPRASPKAKIVFANDQVDIPEVFIGFWV